MSSFYAYSILHCLSSLYTNLKEFGHDLLSWYLMNTTCQLTYVLKVNAFNAWEQLYITQFNTFCHHAIAWLFYHGPIVSLGNHLSILSGGGELVHQWWEEVTYHRDTPCPPKQLVSPMTTEVGNNPNNREIAKQNSYRTYQKVATVHTCVIHRTTSHRTTSLHGNPMTHIHTSAIVQEVLGYCKCPCNHHLSI